MTPRPASLPEPAPEARAQSGRLTEHLRARLDAAGGWISFADYMQEALYAPGLGYYSAGSRKLGPAGDFVTAPELTPLFGQAIAQQAAQLVRAGVHDMLELGAGSGALAVAVLEELARRDALPDRYYVLEVSADLRERAQALLQARVPQLASRVQWLDRLPAAFRGFVLGNEVLDAMPVNLIQTHAAGIDELGVAYNVSSARFAWSRRPAQGELLDAAQALALPVPYRTEIGLVARGFMATIGRMLERGAALFIDYGFPAREYYHAQRSMGTLRCHYRHHVLDDPFFLPGLVDITAHVDFSAMAGCASAAGLALTGYTSQANLLVNCGITELLARVPASEPGRYLPLANAVQRLVSPAEMGELFKAIAFTRGVDELLLGFARGDRRAAL